LFYRFTVILGFRVI